MVTKIKINESQPLNCPKCNEKHGYQYYDTFRMAYIAVNNANGTYERGEYTDGKRLKKGRKAYCSNCGNILPFSLIREDCESSF